MPAYRLMSTRHHPNGSIETPSTIRLSASDDRDAAAQARRYPLEDFVEEADYAWLVDETGEGGLLLPGRDEPSGVTVSRETVALGGRPG